MVLPFQDEFFLTHTQHKHTNTHACVHTDTNTHALNVECEKERNLPSGLYTYVCVCMVSCVFVSVLVYEWERTMHFLLPLFFHMVLNYSKHKSIYLRQSFCRNLLSWSLHDTEMLQVESKKKYKKIAFFALWSSPFYGPCFY